MATIKTIVRLLHGNNARRNFNAAVLMIGHGARTPVVMAACGYSKKAALTLYREVQADRPAGGQMPNDQEWVHASSTNCMHASLFYSIHYHIARTFADERCVADIFVTAYAIYTETAAANKRPNLVERKRATLVVLDINRAWAILRHVESGVLALNRCKKCAARYLAIRGYPDALLMCPICDVWGDKLGRQRWKHVSFKEKDIQ